jgi:hypothetical protein
MKASNLLPYRVKRLGWLLLLPSLFLGVMVMFFEFEIPDFSISIPYESGIFTGKAVPNNLTNELAAVIVMVVLSLIAFSEERDEDEWISKIRLESMQWSVYANYILLVLSILFLYGGGFFQALVFNMYTMQIIFILRFNYVLRVKFNPNRIEAHEK